MSDAKRDGNFVPTLLAVSSADGSTPVALYADPTTHRLYVDIAGGGTVDSFAFTDGNGFAGVVTDPTGAVSLALSTTVTGMVKGNGTALSAATQGVDYYAPAGDDVAVADGGTGKSSWTQYLIPYADTTTSFAQIPIGTAGQVLTSGGAGVAPSFASVGSGTVTTVSVTTANGVSGSVATATSTPAITLTLGAITPSSVNSVVISGTSTPTLAVTGTTSVSGANTGDNAANSSSTYIGTTAVALNRASGALTLAGITLTTPDIGTPSAGVLTNATGLPIAGLVASTTTALGVGSIELGHASDTTIARVSAGVISVEGVTIPTISSTSTLTNKRITQRVVTTTDDATAVIDVDVTDQYQLTAVANATTFSTTGTPTAGQKLLIRFKDAGVAKGLTWDAVFRVVGVTLPTTTVASKTHYVGCVYNTTDTKWDVLAVAVQA